MAFVDQLVLVRDDTFRQRVMMAAVIAAQQVSGEAMDPTNTPEFYIRRANLATRVLASPMDLADAFAWSVAASPTVTAESSDSDLQWTVNSVWDDISGASLIQTIAAAP